MKHKILHRIVNKIDNNNIYKSIIENLSLADLQSLLLEIYRDKSGRLNYSNLLNQYKSNRFVQHTKIPFERSMKFDEYAFSKLPKGYNTLELSPVSPLGTSSVVAHVDQHNILTTVRNTEVCSDSSNVLALESAVIREKLLKTRQTQNQKVKLCTSHRVLRTQLMEGKDCVPHFRLLSLCAAGRDAGSYKFESDTLYEQLAYYIELLLNLKQLAITLKNIKIVFSVFDNNITEKIKIITHELLKLSPETRFEFNNSKEKQNYYQTLRYNIFATNSKDEEYFLCDGGFTDWTQKLLQNKKERYLISGFGSERLFLVF